ncbi:MAG: carboxypeptidase-like regulatory domain-containing protein [Bacteroidaceae bacterium]|nr:carboxypeptidase-like regulatory domain-containing protein [Bacteroidaceae bacterium]
MKQTFLLLILLFCLPIEAQQTYRARVVDAETGEALPMARVFVSAENYTVANEDGGFSIQTAPSGVLRISYVGYETQEWKATNLPSQIKMRPLTRELGEVRAIPVERIMLKLIKKLNTENHRNGSRKAHYFYRFTNIGVRQTLIIEAFIRAYSTININKARVLNGRIFQQDSTISCYESMPEEFCRFQHEMFELAPEIPPGTRSVFSEGLNLPLPEWAETVSDLAGRDFSCAVLRSEKGEEIYRIDVQVDAAASALAGEKYALFSPKHALSGTLYLKKKPLRLLSFDGELTGFHMLKPDSSKHPASIHLHIDYRHSSGYTEPTTVYCVMKSDDFETRMLAFMVDNRRLEYIPGCWPYNNEWQVDFLYGIKNSRYKPKLWTNEIVRRTEEEERIVRKMAETPDE